MLICDNFVGDTGSISLQADDSVSLVAFIIMALILENLVAE